MADRPPSRSHGASSDASAPNQPSSSRPGSQQGPSQELPGPSSRHSTPISISQGPLDGTSPVDGQNDGNGDRMGEPSTGPGLPDGVIGIIPRYAMPNISSMLPVYSNSEQEFVFRTFNVGNYDLIRHLPGSLKEQQVTAARTARSEAARRFLMPVISGPVLSSNPDNQQGLFSTFEYIPSRFSIADELASKERVESEARRMAIGGKDFTPADAKRMPKQADFDSGKLYPYLGGGYEGVDESHLAHRWAEDSKALGGAFVPSGTDKLAERPSRKISWDMMRDLVAWIKKDWEGADVSIFENHEDCWVIKVLLESVDSQSGLVAYMNVFVRCNELVNKYQLTRVVEFWNTTPGDGYIYFVVRPPWVRPQRLEAFFTLNPEERHWSSSHAVQEVQKTRPARDGADADEKAEQEALAAQTSSLKYRSRLDWGANFLTGTAAPAVLGRQIPGQTTPA